jgi:PAS domain S-box-containing protein
MKKDTLSEATNLRLKAEKLATNKLSKAEIPHSEAEVLKLIHELEVHQIELELQNEELILSKELAAANASEKYAELYDFAPSGYFTLTKNGEIIELNLSASQMLGKERSYLKNTNFNFYVSNDTKPIFKQFLQKVLNSKTKETCELSLLNNGNPPIYVFLTGIATENGEQCLVTAIDISERKLAELILKEKNEEIETKNIEYLQLNKKLQQTNAELLIAKERAEESDRLKAAFLRNISHEIRTPLNSIVGFSKILNNPNLLPEKRQHITEVIEKNSQQLLSIVSNIINISSIEAGQEKVYETEINLNKILTLLNDQFLLKAEEQNICLNMDVLLPDNEVNIVSDQTKLEQIISNLISNALKFTKHGYVNFGYKIKNNEVEFYVEDTGIGILPEMQEEIFKRFRQVETTLARQFGGSGLGLSISKAYVELLGGKMWLNSELEKGSTFYFTIPYKKASNNTISDKQSDILVDLEIKELKTILIAEDEDSNFLLFKESLSGFNIHIIRAINGAEAVGICKANKNIDLVFMDIKMPIMDGYEATRIIKGFMPDVPIIAQTAYSTEADKDKAFACGCIDYISKPFDLELLFSKIKTQLGKAID